MTGDLDTLLKSLDLGRHALSEPEQTEPGSQNS